MTGAQYAALLGLWIAGIVVPGPDVFVILRNAFLSSRRNAVFTALGVMLGNLANQQGPGGVWPFTFGAMLGSISWFLVIGYGARGLSRYLARPRVWQILDIVIAVVLVVLAARLALG